MKYIITIICTLFIGKSVAQSKKELVRFNAIVHQSAQLAKMNHYFYSNFDDTFSKKVFADYFEAVDKWHAIYLQADIDVLSKYETKLDDELNGAPVRFSVEAALLYRKRLVEVQKIFFALLSEPFNLNSDNMFLSTAPGAWPTNKVEQVERWRQWLTSEIEREMYSLQQEQKQKGITSTTTQLEQDARMAVKKNFNGYWYCLQHKMTDELYLARYMNIFAHTLDPHSFYLDAIGQELLTNVRGGTICGVGIETDLLHGMVQVTKLEQGGAAAQSGKIDVGDVIISVKEPNGKPEDIAGYTINFRKRVFEGAAGTELTLNCQKPNGTMYAVTLKRTLVKVTSAIVNTAIIEKDGNKIGYMLLPEFYEGMGINAGDDVAKAVKVLNIEKVTAIVIDMRNNRGGSLTQCIKALSEFFAYSPLIQTKFKIDPLQVLKSNNKSMNFSGPLVLLANQKTVSCGDLFTSVIQDYNRGLIMGSPTAGKGTGGFNYVVTQLWGDQLAEAKKENFGLLSLTIMKYYSITGRSIHKKGVQPDVPLSDYRYDDSEIESAHKNTLPSDSINPVPYTAWNYGFDLESVKKTMRQQVDSNAIYKQIAENEAWLKKADEEPVPLNWRAYSALRKEMDRRLNQSEELGRLKVKLSVRLLSGQDAKAQQDFLNKIDTDIYIKTAADAALELLKTM